MSISVYFIERLSSPADGLRDQNRVERQRGNQKGINESLSRLLEHSEAITVSNLTQCCHFKSSAPPMCFLPASRNDLLKVEQ